jgi:hypothetical protein
MSVLECLRQLWNEPGEMLLRRWNWKSAIFSSLIRANIFFLTNLAAGWRAAAGAMFAELLYRAITAGFYGALTQAFREVEPEWAAGIAVSVLLPVSSHTFEFGIHLMRHTPRLYTSIVTSICFTIVSTLFNQYAMRRGALVVGEGSGSVGSDLKRIPELIARFVTTGPVVLYRTLAGALTPAVQEFAGPGQDA